MPALHKAHQAMIGLCPKVPFFRRLRLHFPILHSTYPRPAKAGGVVAEDPGGILSREQRLPPMMPMCRHATDATQAPFRSRCARRMRIPQLHKGMRTLWLAKSGL